MLAASPPPAGCRLSCPRSSLPPPPILLPPAGGSAVSHPGLPFLLARCPLPAALRPRLPPSGECPQEALHRHLEPRPGRPVRLGRAPAPPRTILFATGT